MSDSEKQRYNRQIIVPGWGEEGQKKVKETTVFIAGAGGLGSTVGYYLAASGVGCLRICDSGEVELSNLNRQIIHSSKDIGRRKVDSAVESLTALNPHALVVPLYRRIVEETVDELVADAGIIVDCLDNFETRYVLNEYAVKMQIPLVHAGVYGFTGQITFINSPETPCLRCLFPAQPQPSEIFPIVGAAAGVIGAVEAIETLKWIIGGFTLLKGRLLIFEGELASFDEITVSRDPACPVCGLNA